MQSRDTYFAHSHSRIVSAQSRTIDQVRIVVILFLLGQRLNLILNLVGCSFDWDIIFLSVKRLIWAALNDNWNHVRRWMLTFFSIDWKDFRLFVDLGWLEKCFKPFCLGWGSIRKREQNIDLPNWRFCFCVPSRHAHSCWVKQQTKLARCRWDL